MLPFKCFDELEPHKVSNNKSAVISVPSGLFGIASGSRREFRQWILEIIVQKEILECMQICLLKFRLSSESLFSVGWRNLCFILLDEENVLNDP